jgi:hypothetical protein
MVKLAMKERRTYMGYLLSVLTSPTATFQRLKEEKGGWFLPMTVLIILSLVGVWLITPVTVAMIDQQLLKNPVGDAGLEQFTRTGAIVGAYVGAVVGTPVQIFVGALLLLLLNLIVTGEATYKQLVKVVLFSKVPVMISLLITGILARATNATSLFDIGLNAGSFVEDKTSILYGVLALIDPFAIWGLVLLIIGTAVMTERSRGKIAAWIVSVWVVISLITALANSVASKLS